MAMFDTSINTGVAGQQAVTPVQDVSGANKMAVGQAALTLYGVGKDVKTQYDVRSGLNEIEGELKGLDEQFSSISNALDKGLATGTKKSQLQAKARALVAQEKANNPGQANAIDSLYTAYFGTTTSNTGNGNAGSFKLTAQEEAAAKAQEDISKQSMLTGIPETEIIKMNQVKAQAENLKNVQSLNASNITGYTTIGVADFQSDFNVQFNSALKASGGTLTADDRAALQYMINEKELALKNEIRKKSVDANGNSVVDNDMITAQIKRVETESENMRTILADSSYTKWMEENNNQKKAEFTSVAISKNPEITYLNNISPQVAAAYINASLYQNKAQIALLNRMFGDDFAALHDPQNFARSGLDYMAFMKGDEAKKPTSQGAVAVSHSMATNPQLAFKIMGEWNEPMALRRMTEMNPDAMVKVTTSTTKPQGPEATENTKTVLDQLSINLQSMIRANTGSFGSGFTITESDVRPSSERPYVKFGAKEYKIAGQQTSPEVNAAILNMIKVAEANPDLIPEGFTPTTLVQEMLNKGTHIDSLQPPTEDFSYTTTNPKGEAKPSVSQPKDITAANNAFVEQVSKALNMRTVVDPNNPESFIEITPQEEAAFKDWKEQGVTPESLRNTMDNMRYRDPKTGKLGEPQQMVDNANIIDKYRGYLEGNK